MRKTKTIAIDGPASSGKTTIAKKLSKLTGFYYLNTGAIYRAAAIYYIKNNIDTSSSSEIVRNLDNININVDYKNGNQITMLGEKDVSDKIYNDLTSDIASKISAVSQVRERMNLIQRLIAGKFNTIIEGRDIGTRICPAADLKIFLHANPKVRAKRRHMQYLDYYNSMSKKEEDILEEIKIRDERDSNRKTSPLKPAADAVLLDTSDMNSEQVIEYIVRIIKERGIC